MKSINTLFSAILFIICTAYHSSAQAPTWHWAHSAANGAAASVTGMGSDADGNTYALGIIGGSIGFGNLPQLTDRMYLVKHNPQGSPLWAIQASCNPYGIAVDPAGNSYITGAFQDTLDFGGHVLVCLGEMDAFVAKVDSSGSVVWVRQAGGTGNPHKPPMPPIMEDLGMSIGTDTAGNCYVSVLVEASDTSAALFDTISVFPPNSTLMPRGFNVLAKYNPAGDIQWARPITTNYKYLNRMAVSNSGVCYVTGIFSGTLDFGSHSLQSNGQDDICLASYDLIGDLQWARSIGGSGSEFVSDIASDRQGNVLLTGSFQDTIQIGSNTLIKQFDSSNQRRTLFLAKFNGNGNPLWASQAHGTGSAGDSQLAIDSSGNSYLHSTFSDSVFIGQYQFNSTGSSQDLLVSKWDSLGNAVWAVAAQGGGNDFSGGIALAPSATSLYVSGTFDGGLNFGNIQLTTSQKNFFLAKLDHIVSGIPTQMQSVGTIVYPNPAAESFHVLLPGETVKNGTFLLYSITGQLMKEVKFSNASHVLVKRDSLPAGLYLYRIESGGKIEGAGKIVLE